MRILTIETYIMAPTQHCFDLARDIAFHCKTASFTHERAVAGITEGLIGLGQCVTFEGVHFGVRLRHTSRITEFDSPNRFVDEMTEGAFKRMKHIHEFSPNGTRIVMRDTLIWESPPGILGRLADALAIERHLRRFLITRNSKLKAEAELWRQRDAG